VIDLMGRRRDQRDEEDADDERYRAGEREDAPVDRRRHVEAPEADERRDVDGAALDELAAEGAELIDARPHRGLFGLQVAFVHPDAVHGVLAEIVSVG